MNKDNLDILTLTGEHQFNLSDFALFLTVMKNKTAYQNTLSIILDEPDLELLEVKTEEVILNRSGKRAIRLDAWAIDRRHRQFDMEMQNDITGDDLAKRSRFYQSMIDTPILKAGRKTRYRQLPSTVIIFITLEDFFGRDRTMYTFRERCIEEPELLLEDGTQKIFLNMTSTNGREELVSLLQYMKNTSLDNPDIINKDPRILALDKIVQEVRESEEWEAVQMNIWQLGREAGRTEGQSEGISQGECKKLIAQICKKLKKNKSPETIADELEEDLGTVQQLCTLAAKYAPDYDCEKIFLDWKGGE